MSDRQPLAPRSAYPLFTQIQTRWLDNDVYGHVNNTVYYTWFDTAVNTHLIAAGVLDIDQGATIGLVVETGCLYARSLSFPEVIDVGIRVAHLGRSSVRYELGLFTAGRDDAAAQGHFVHVYVDRSTRRPVALDDDWRRVLAKLAA